MDSVSLMKRVDTKFLINRKKLESIFSSLSSHYKILKVKDVIKSKYSSFYFDTVNYKFFLDHHNGKLNRAKVRFREYVDSKTSFLEVKRKNQKNVDPFQKHFELNMNVVLLNIIDPIINKKKKP